jgi:hypothetical protein
MPGLVPGIHVFGNCRKKKTWMAGTSPAMTQRTAGLLYSITACSGVSDCLRSAALVEPIMIASGIEARMNIITS